MDLIRDAHLNWRLYLLLREKFLDLYVVKLLAVIFQL